MKGSCLCKAIRYEVDQLDSAIRHCHCQTCRKAHAAAFNSGAAVKREHFRWLQGQSKLASYESSPGKFRHFCSVCGSQLLSERPDQPTAVLRVATLDDDPEVKAQMHIWTSQHAPWLNYEGLTEYPEQAT